MIHAMKIGVAERGADGRQRRRDDRLVERRQHHRHQDADDDIAPLLVRHRLGAATYPSKGLGLALAPDAEIRGRRDAGGQSRARATMTERCLRGKTKSGHVRRQRFSSGDGANQRCARVDQHDDLADQPLIAKSFGV